MAVEYEISSDVAVIKETGSISQCARVTQMYSGQITYDDEAGSKFATATINGKSQRVMLCIAVNGTVNYDDVPSLYSTVDGHRCLNIVTPTETGTPDDVPSLYETVVIDGQNVRAVRCIMINKTPVYDGVSSTCTFTGDDGKTHTAQLVNKVTGGSVVVIIKGTSPLNLPDAVANSLSYVKAFGGTEQRDIPDNYLQRQFIYMMDGSYLLTDIVPASNYKVEMDFQTTNVTTVSEYYLGVRDVSGGVEGLAIVKRPSSVGNTLSFDGFQAGNRYNSTYVPTSNTRYKYTYDNGTITLTKDNTVVASHTFTPDSTVTSKLAINGFNDNGSVLVNPTGVYLYSFKVWNAQGELVIDLVPAVEKGAVPVVGFYDTVSGTFKTATAGTFAAGTQTAPTPDTPMDIVSNNGVLKYSKNLLDMSPENIVLGRYINNSGAVIYSDLNFYNNKYIPVVAGGTYTWSTSSSISYFSVMEYDSDYVFTRRTLFSSAGTSGSITLLPDTAFVLIGSNMDSTKVTLDEIAAVDWQFEKGSATTPYMPYGQFYTDGTVETIEDTIGNTATTEMLLKVGDYQDEQEILSGAVTRNVGVKVLDGTEDGWTKLASASLNIYRLPIVGAYRPSSTTSDSMLCTHFPEDAQPNSDMGNKTAKLSYLTTDTSNGVVMFKYQEITTLEDWKAYLTNQYAAGTPVIVIYPLATPTTESVARQTLQVQDGDNVLEITQASLNNLELEAQYKAAVQLTIQEVQDANLDNNVEVTIS